MVKDILYEAINGKQGGVFHHFLNRPNMGLFNGVHSVDGFQIFLHAIAYGTTDMTQVILNSHAKEVGLFLEHPAWEQRVYDAIRENARHNTVFDSKILPMLSSGGFRPTHRTILKIGILCDQQNMISFAMENEKDLGFSDISPKNGNALSFAINAEVQPKTALYLIEKGVEFRPQQVVADPRSMYASLLKKVSNSPIALTQAEFTAMAIQELKPKQSALDEERAKPIGERIRR